MDDTTPDYWCVRLKQFREIAGLTQIELSEKSGVSQSWITNLENGKRNFTQKSLSDILRVLGKSYHDLFMMDTSSTSQPVIINHGSQQQPSIHAITSLMGIAEYVTECGTGAQYERLRSFGELIRKEIEDVKKDKSLQSMNVPGSSPMNRPDGLKIVNGGK